MRLNKKGISPLIATVLLIGFTVALAGVVITWGGGFIKNITTGTEESTSETIACTSDLKFDITKVYCGYNNTKFDEKGNVNPDDDTWEIDPSTITIDNKGTLDLIKITFRFFDDGGEALTHGAAALGDEADPALKKFSVKKLNLYGIDQKKEILLVDRALTPPGSWRLNPGALIPVGAAKVEAIAVIMVGGKNVTCSNAISTKKFRSCVAEDR